MNRRVSRMTTTVQAPDRLFLATFLILGIGIFLPLTDLSAQEDTPCSPEPTNMPVSYGDLISCQLETTGDSDIFTFAGAAGDVIVAQVAESGGFGEPCLEIFRPDASILASACETNNPRIDITLDQSGTYAILVTDDNDDETMSYNLALERHFPTVDSATTIDYGNLIEDQVLPNGDLDLFTFTGTTGDVIIAQVAESGGFGEPCLEIFRPDASLLTSACEINNPGIDITLDQTGTHTILVTDDNDDETMSYSLIVDTVVPLSCSAVHIEFASSLPGDITPVGDFDIVSFFGTSGDLILLTLAETAGFGEPCIELFGPSGTVVDAACDTNNATLTLTLNQNGVHTILMSDDNDDETISYNIDIQCIGMCTEIGTSCGIFSDGFESGGS